MPWILTGDFNSTPTSAVYKYLTNKDIGDADEEEYKVGKVPFPEAKSAYELLREPTFTNYTLKFKACIDYILYDSNNLTTTDLVWVDETKFDGLAALPSQDHSSDHLPLYAAFCYTAKKLQR